MKTVQDVKNFFAELDRRLGNDWNPDRNFLEDPRLTVKDALDLNDRMRDACANCMQDQKEMPGHRESCAECQSAYDLNR